MKLLLLGDTHWGVRNNSKYHLDNIKKVIAWQLLPYLKENRIDRIIHLGDLVHDRKSLNIYTIYRLRKDFLEPLDLLNIPVDILMGNHDTFYRTTNEVNALDEIVGDRYKNINIVHEIYQSCGLVLCPWICKENEERIFEFLNDCNGPYFFGHLELKGFDYFKGVKAEHGLDANIFKRFKRVFSGHYHTSSSIGNVSYIGAFSDHIWSDCNDFRGFSVFDTDSGKLVQIESRYRMFHRIHYDENVNYDLDEYNDCYVKVYVKDDIKDHHKLDKFINDLDDRTIDTQVSKKEKEMVMVDTTNMEVESTLTFFQEYIKEMNDVDHNNLTNLMTELYMESMS